MVTALPCLVRQTLETGQALLTDPVPQLRVINTQPTAWCHAEHPDLSDVGVELHFSHRRAAGIEGVYVRQSWIHYTASEQTIRFPGLLVVPAMAAEHPFPPHPKESITEPRLVPG